MKKEKIKVEIYTNANRAFEDEAEEILKDKDKKAIINILKNNFDLEDSLLDLESQLKLYKDNKKYLNKEIERLNNIINEIKEELEAYIRLCVDVNANDILDMIEHYIKGDE